jgi:hypothetical protein
MLLFSSILLEPKKKEQNKTNDDNRLMILCPSAKHGEICRWLQSFNMFRKGESSSHIKNKGNSCNFQQQSRELNKNPWAMNLK